MNPRRLPGYNATVAIKRIDDEQVAEIYRNSLLSTRQVAAQLGFSVSTVRRSLRVSLPASEYAELAHQRLLAHRRPSYGMLGKTRSQDANAKQLATMRARFPDYTRGLTREEHLAGRAGRYRARKLYPLVGVLCPCGQPATDRHHVDGDPSNNIRSNVALLCSSCHMRLHAFARWERAKRTAVS